MLIDLNVTGLLLRDLLVSRSGSEEFAELNGRAW